MSIEFNDLGYKGYGREVRRQIGSPTYYKLTIYEKESYIFQIDGQTPYFFDSARAMLAQLRKSYWERAQCPIAIVLIHEEHGTKYVNVQKSLDFTVDTLDEFLTELALIL